MDELDIPSVYRVPRQRGLDPTTRRMAWIAGVLGGALLLVVGFWALSGHRPRAVPVIAADDRPVRVKPDNPGGMVVAGQDEEILSGAGTDGTGKLAPPPESPAPQSLRQQLAQPRPAPPPAASPSPAPSPPQPFTAPSSTAPSSVPPPSPPPPSPPPVTAQTTPPAAGGSVPEHATNEHAAPEHPTEVQLAALDSEHAARDEWDRLSHRMPDLLGTRRPILTRVEREGHTLWRLRTGGFSDIAQATQFCERIRAKGSGCTLATF